MKTPSTSDLTHAQANTAYDRLAVISDHMPMLHELCEYIFDLQDWLKANQHKFLQEFVDNMNDELAKVKANLESLALTHDTDKIALQNAMNSINSNITNLTNLINQVDDKTVGLLIHNLNPSDDTHGATCMAIAEYVSAKIAVLTGNLGNLGSSLDSILNRLSSLETRVTNLENTVGGLGSGSSTTGTIIVAGIDFKNWNVGAFEVGDTIDISPSNSLGSEGCICTNIPLNSYFGGDGSSGANLDFATRTLANFYPPSRWRCLRKPTYHTANLGHTYIDSHGYYQLVDYLI